MPDALAGLAASAALALSDIPFKTLISEARVGRSTENYYQSKSCTIRIIRYDMMIELLWILSQW
jgi:polyribonucleotide nucleotidyltransferase